MNLNFYTNFKSVTNSTVWKGNGQNENNYLVSKEKLTERIPIEKRIYSEYGKLDEKAFLLQSDSIYQLYMNHFKSHKSLERDFAFLEEHSIKIEHAIRLADFETAKRMLTNDPNFKVSENYPDIYEGVDLNNAKLLQTFGYQDMMRNYVSSLVASSKGYSDSSDFFVLFQQELADSDLKPAIKDRLGFDSSKYGFSYAKDVDLYYKIYMSFVSNEEYKNKFQEHYNTIKLARGSSSPNFNLVDANNKWYSLDHFKGKYIYIDLWASWCLPCIKQIPHLKNLEKKYGEKVNFVSIAWNDNKDKWIKALKKFELSGHQLYAPDKKDDFFQFYDVNSLPRFILLDKNGNIIESNAKQPSDKSLDKQLNDLE